MPGGCKPQTGIGDQVVERYFSVYFCSEYSEYFFYFSFVVYATERQVSNYGTLRSMHCHISGKNGLRQDVLGEHRTRRLRTSMNQLAVDA